MPGTTGLTLFSGYKLLIIYMQVSVLFVTLPALTEFTVCFIIMHIPQHSTEEQSELLSRFLKFLHLPFFFNSFFLFLISIVDFNARIFFSLNKTATNQEIIEDILFCNYFIHSSFGSIIKRHPFKCHLRGCLLIFDHIIQCHLRV